MTPQVSAVEAEVRMIMQRWCPVTNPEPGYVTQAVDVFLGAFSALSDCLEACGLERGLDLDDPRVPLHLAGDSFALGQVDAAFGTLVEESGAALGPAQAPFANVGSRCPIPAEAYTHVSEYLTALIGPRNGTRPLTDWLVERTASLRAQAGRCSLPQGGPR